MTNKALPLYRLDKRWSDLCDCIHSGVTGNHLTLSYIGGGGTLQMNCEQIDDMS